MWWANTAAIEATQSLFSRVALELATTYTKGLDALQSTAAVQLNASKADLGQSLTDEISAALSSVSAQQAEVVEEVSALTATLADLQSEVDHLSDAQEKLEACLGDNKVPGPRRLVQHHLQALQPRARCRACRRER